MGMFGILDISSAGMDVQQARLEAAASNIANARTTGEGGAVYQPLTVVVRSAAAQEHGTAGMPVSLDNLPLPTAERADGWRGEEIEHGRTRDRIARSRYGRSPLPYPSPRSSREEGWGEGFRLSPR